MMRQLTAGFFQQTLKRDALLHQPPLQRSLVSGSFPEARPFETPVLPNFRCAHPGRALAERANLLAKRAMPKLQLENGFERALIR
jgi:hypothetical protein